MKFVLAADGDTSRQFIELCTGWMKQKGEQELYDFLTANPQELHFSRGKPEPIYVVEFTSLDELMGFVSKYGNREVMISRAWPLESEYLIEKDEYIYSLDIDPDLR